MPMVLSFKYITLFVHPNGHLSRRRETLTPSAGGGAFRPEQVVPGEAGLIIPASCPRDGYVEPVADAQVLLLQEDLRSREAFK